MLLMYVCTCVSECVCARSVSESARACRSVWKRARDEGQGDLHMRRRASSTSLCSTCLAKRSLAKACISRATFCVSFLCTPCDLAKRAGSCSPTRHAQTMQRTDHPTGHTLTIASVCLPLGTCHTLFTQTCHTLFTQSLGKVAPGFPNLF